MGTLMGVTSYVVSGSVDWVVGLGESVDTRSTARDGGRKHSLIGVHEGMSEDVE